MKEEESAAGCVSQFQPPSGHCQRSNRTASRTHRSSGQPNAVTYRSALPCWEPCQRARPRMTGTPERHPPEALEDAGYVRKKEGRSQSCSAWSISGFSEGSPGGYPTSTKEASNQ
jgi:hypothetical protein